MKKSLIIVGSIFVISLFLCGCTEEKPKTNPLSNLGYSNTEHGFGLNPPEDWVVDENDDYGVVRFTGPIVDELAVNFGITESFPLGTETLESIVEIMIESCYTTFLDFAEISNSSITVNGMDAYDIVYSYTLLGAGIYGKQILVEKNNNVVVITYAAGLTSYDTHLDEFDQSVASFTMI